MQVSVKKRKLLLVLPVLVIPFLTLGFYALGGGQGKKEPVSEADGLNPNLPPANLSEKVLDKLGFYDKAARDSAKKAEWMRTDPYYQEPTTLNELEAISERSALKFNQRLNLSPYEGRTLKPEDEVLQKLEKLQAVLDQEPEEPAGIVDEFSPVQPGLPADMDRLEAMMNQMKSPNPEDPELQQISSVMDKILDVQYPERVRERMEKMPSKEISNANLVLTRSAEDTLVKGFYGMEVETVSDSGNAVAAVAPEDQVLVNGSVIKFRLLQDVFVGREKIPAGTFVVGLATLNGERLMVTIESIRSGGSLFPVKMELYDLDGLPGIHIPGAITRDVAKQSADNSLQTLELTTLDPSLKAQAAAAGIHTAKSLLSRKVKLIKVMVKAGYKVLLKNKV